MTDTQSEEIKRLQQEYRLGKEELTTDDLVSDIKRLPSHWWSSMRSEWADRTWYGRLLYPAWLAFSALLWLLLSVVMVAVVLTWVYDMTLSGINRLTPEKCKNDE